MTQEFHLLQSACSYKLGHSEVHTAWESETPLLTPALPANLQAEDPDRPGSTTQVPDSRLEQRLQQLELDMTKVRCCL